MLAVVLAARKVFQPAVSIVWLAALTLAGGATYWFVLWLTARDVVRELVDRVRHRYV